jgi:hypothetical protein
MFNFRKNFLNINNHYNNDFNRNLNLTKDSITIKNLTEEKKRKNEPVINNYNVRVNILKRKTKNISIGNLTMNNNNKNDIFNFLNQSNSRNKSPINPLNIKQFFDKKFEKKKSKNKSKSKSKDKSTKETPRSFEKIINNLKSEFTQIQYKNTPQKRTIKNYYNKYINKSFNLNFNQPLTKDFKFFIKNKSKNKNQKYLPLNISNNIKNETYSNEKVANTTTCFINNITFDMNNENNYDFENQFIQSKQISFSIIKQETLFDKENIQLKLNEKNNLIDILLKIIKIQNNFFCNNIKFYAEKYFKYLDNKINKELKEQINILVNENKKLKNVSLSFLYFIKNDYSINIEKEKKIKEKISELIKENSYLRKITQSLNYLKDVNYHNLKFKNKFGEEEDDITYLLQQILSEKNSKKKNKLINYSDTVNVKDYKKTESNIKSNINENKKGNNIFKIKRFIKYQKKKNI